MSNQNTVTPGLAIFERLAPLGYPLIRITAGLMLMPHGAQKLFGWFGGYGLEATGQFFDKFTDLKDELSGLHLKIRSEENHGNIT